VGDEVDLAEARGQVVPVGEGPDRDLALEQGARLGARPPLDLEPRPLGCEQRSIVAAEITSSLSRTAEVSSISP
jgi:hypothetical protein